MAELVFKSCAGGGPAYPIHRRSCGEIREFALQAVQIEPVSDRSLPKTGVLQMSAGDYRIFRSENAVSRSLETGSIFAKARHWRAFLRASWPFYLDAVLAGWGRRIRTSIW